MDRDEQLAEAFVELADSLARDVDPVVLLDRLVGRVLEFSGADAAGVMVATLRGTLRTVAVTDEGTGLHELFELQAGEGPCLDCYRSDTAVDVPDLTSSEGRWPRMAPLAVRSGFRATHALPLRVNHQTIGAINLLCARPGGRSPAELRVAQALADVGAIALYQWSPESARPTDVLRQVEAALAAKSTVEIAQGMLAEYGDLPLADALAALRVYSRHNGGRLLDTAHALVGRSIDPHAVLTDQH
ncbi:GAF domain-containing protein [Streptomyces sp. Q6]|uniref:GAF domain-containing protein n=1 Tax=Streptomyces citrinus TaxID=3118173 RepID=A0ACD5AAP3_9ACTN